MLFPGYIFFENACQFEMQKIVYFFETCAFRCFSHNVSKQNLQIIHLLSKFR